MIAFWRVCRIVRVEAFAAQYNDRNVPDQRMNFIMFLVLLLHLVGGQSAPSPLERLRTKIAVDPVTNVTPVQFAGQYANPSKEVMKSWGGGTLSRDDLYIFPDKTYIYCRWADILPTTVYDKGTWSFVGEILELKSDPQITWDPELERKFLAVRRPAHNGEILLVGTDRDIKYFEENTGDDPEFMLLLNSKERERILSRSETARLKAKLMRESWRPEYFRK